MFKPRSGLRTKPLTYEQALAKLPAAEKAMRDEAYTHSDAYEQCVQNLHELYAVMARDAARSIRASRRYNELVTVVNEGESNASA